MSQKKSAEDWVFEEIERKIQDGKSEREACGTDALRKRYRRHKQQLAKNVEIEKCVVAAKATPIDEEATLEEISQGILLYLRNCLQAGMADGGTARVALDVLKVRHRAYRAGNGTVITPDDYKNMVMKHFRGYKPAGGKNGK